MLVTRLLLTPLALSVNLLAASTRYPMAHVLLPVVEGEIEWVPLFAGLGHVFAQSWERICAWVDDSPGQLLDAALVALCAWGPRQLKQRPNATRRPLMPLAATGRCLSNSLRAPGFSGRMPRL